jgi:hypothetical protein
MTIEEKEWRRLCKLVAEETDPRRLSKLIDELIRALDVRRRDLHTSEVQPKAGNGQ